MVEPEKTYCGINDGKEMKTRLNNILNANTWLFIELVVITVVAWAVFDPAIVNLYYRSLPLGYDSGQLLYAQTVVGGEWTPDKSGTPQDPYRMTEERRLQMLRQLTSVEGVASAYFYNDAYGSIGFTNESYSECYNGSDTLYLTTVSFVSDSHFFETYGLRPLPGSPSAEELSQIKRQDNQVVLTRSGAIALFGTADVVGRQFTLCYNPPFVVTVAGVVEDFRKSMTSNLRSLIFIIQDNPQTDCQCVIRLKDGIDAHRFVEEHGQELIRSGKTDFNRIRRLMTFEDRLRQLELDDGRTQEVNRSLALTFFFLVNLMLAVIGTVWLHAKRHTEECGVRRAFGATRWRMLGDFLCRNALLATVAVVFGCIIYLNYAYSGITEYDGEEYCETLYTIRMVDLTSDKSWPDYFWPHFLVVSAIVYLVIIITVLIGTAIPAWKICRIKIADALRDE